MFRMTSQQEYSDGDTGGPWFLFDDTGGYPRWIRVKNTKVSLCLQSGSKANLIEILAYWRIGRTRSGDKLTSDATTMWGVRRTRADQMKLGSKGGRESARRFGPGFI